MRRNPHTNFIYCYHQPKLTVKIRQRWKVVSIGDFNFKKSRRFQSNLRFQKFLLRDVTRPERNNALKVKVLEYIKKRRKELVSQKVQSAIKIPFASPEARLVDEIVLAAREVKGKDIHVLKIGDLSSIADYMVVISGRSDRQVQGIANRIIDAIYNHGKGTVPFSIEGLEQGLWVLIDFSGVIVHIFYESLRVQYEIEKLWSKATLYDLSDERSTFLPRLSLVAA